ncbi:MAG TPA: hypothetical protein VE129_00980, partial [Thermoanaerobaculia bacterium]|nr:hypothetical protein [Thermoanaerobaculia bacterium]
SLGGQPATVDFDYRGPAYNSDPSAATLTSTEDVIRGVFAWFEANGGTGRPIRGTPSIPGINPNIDGTLVSPSTDEFAFGLVKRLGTKGSLRGDVVHRKSNDFYATRVDMGTGTVSGSLAGVTRTFDKQIIVNTGEERREYWGFTLSASYRFFQGLQLQGNWTWARLRGTFDGENAASGSLRSVAPFYSEYRAAEWSRPVGDLGADQRHKVRLWAIYDLPFDVSWFKSSVSILQQYDTGTPYGAVGNIDSRPYVNAATNSAYLNEPSTVVYYFTARDAYRTDDISRTDLSLNLSFRPAGSLEIFIEPQVLNVFNQQNVVTPATTIQTQNNTGNQPGITPPVPSFAAFNPFTEQPKQGPRATGGATPTYNWNYASTFGTPSAATSYQLARTFRVSVGLRF